MSRQHRAREVVEAPRTGLAPIRLPVRLRVSLQPLRTTAALLHAGQRTPAGQRSWRTVATHLASSIRDERFTRSPATLMPEAPRVGRSTCPACFPSSQMPFRHATHSRTHPPDPGKSHSLFRTNGASPTGAHASSGRDTINVALIYAEVVTSLAGAIHNILVACASCDALPSRGTGLRKHSRNHSRVAGRPLRPGRTLWTRWSNRTR